MARNTPQAGAPNAPTPPEGATPGTTPPEGTPPAAADQTPPAGDPAAAAPQPPEPPAPPPSGGGKKVCKIKNEAYAGMAVYGVSGKPCLFGADGIAEVGADDFEHFKKVPGYEPV